MEPAHSRRAEDFELRLCQQSERAAKVKPLQCGEFFEGVRHFLRVGVGQCSAACYEREPAYAKLVRLFSALERLLRRNRRVDAATRVVVCRLCAPLAIFRAPPRLGVHYRAGIDCVPEKFTPQFFGGFAQDSELRGRREIENFVERQRLRVQDFIQHRSFFLRVYRAIF